MTLHKKVILVKTTALATDSSNQPYLEMLGSLCKEKVQHGTTPATFQ